MRVFKVFPNGRCLRIGLLVVLVVGVGVLGVRVGASGTGQPVPGIAYVTMVEDTPDGAILKPSDPDSNTFTTIVSGLTYPYTILCGPDGRLYVTEHLAQDGSREVNRIWRFNQDGSGRTLVGEWENSVRGGLRPSSMIFAPNGDLYFGTWPVANGVPTQGIWRISGALQAEQQFIAPQQILPPGAFLSAKGDERHFVEPYAFLDTGPFQGDLLIVNRVMEGGQFKPGSRVLRALKPNFNSVTEFIPAHYRPETGQSFQPMGLAINSRGDILIADGGSSRIWRYGPNGTSKDMFARTGRVPLQIAIEPNNDLAYVTVLQVGLASFDREGKLIGQWFSSGFLRGVTVCAPK